MKIFIIGAGHMGSWLTEELCHDHEVAVFDTDPRKLKYFINVHRYMSIDEVEDFKPDMVINCVTLNKTEEVFNSIIPLVPDSCILSDITSVKNGIHDYYLKTGKRFVSTHPMFGPTFGNVRNLSSESAIIINESD